jgi:hypothetical protein
MDDVLMLKLKAADGMKQKLGLMIRLSRSRGQKDKVKSLLTFSRI